MKLRHLAGPLLLLISSVAMGVEADLNVSNDAARLTMEFPVRNNILIDGSWLHHTDKGETQMQVYSRGFKAGEQGCVQQSGWTGTVVLLPKTVE